MKTSDRGIAALLMHEGIVPGPYRDSVGVWTVYAGHTASAGAPDPRSMPRGMPADIRTAIDEAFRIFRLDLERYERRVRGAITVPLKQHEFDAAVSFDFNTGGIFSAEWVRSLNAGNRELAAAQIMNWSKPKEIIPRRAAEQRLFNYGAYPDGVINVWQVNEAGQVIWTPIRRISASAAAKLLGSKVPKRGLITSILGVFR